MLIVPEPPKSPKRVFLLATPQHMLQKLRWEIRGLTDKLELQRYEDLTGHHEAAYYAFNAAVTAWHLTDWVWASMDEAGRSEMASAIGLDLSQHRGDTDRLKAFLGAMRKKSSALDICCEIANGSKHKEEREKSSVHASLDWAINPARVGEFRTGDRLATFVFDLIVRDGDKEVTARDVFESAFRFWRKFLATWGFVEPEFIF